MACHMHESAVLLYKTMVETWEVPEDNYDGNPYVLVNGLLIQALPVNIA